MKVFSDSLTVRRECSFGTRFAKIILRHDSVSALIFQTESFNDKFVFAISLILLHVVFFALSQLRAALGPRNFGFRISLDDSLPFDSFVHRRAVISEALDLGFQ